MTLTQEVEQLWQEIAYDAIEAAEAMPWGGPLTESGAREICADMAHGRIEGWSKLSSEERNEVLNAASFPLA